MKHLRPAAVLLALATLSPVSVFAQAAPPNPPARERPYGCEPGREVRRELPPEAKALISRQHQEMEQLRDKYFQELQTLRQKHHQERQALRQKLMQENLAGRGPATSGEQTLK